jgi:hypothetical protein
MTKELINRLRHYELARADYLKAQADYQAQSGPDKLPGHLAGMEMVRRENLMNLTAIHLAEYLSTMMNAAFFFSEAL